MAYIPVLAIAVVLICGGIVDYRKREIPNAVPVILIAVGVTFGFSMIWSIMGLAVPAALMYIAANFTKSEIPGGDFKLLCSLGFACGLPMLTIVILLAGVGALIYGLILCLPIKRHIPLCTYVASAYIALQLAAYALEGGVAHV